MSFKRRYLAWLLLPPVLICLPLAFLFLWQVTQASAGETALLLLLLIVLFAIVDGIIYSAVAPRIDALDSTTGGDVSDALSALLTTTVRTSGIAWIAGGLAFTILATLLILRSALGFAYFLVAACIVAFPAIAWAYFGAKQRIVERAQDAAVAHYIGARVPLGRKIAIIFIGSFIISAAVTVALVSSRVSTTLEELAISSSSDRFARVFEVANLSANVTPAELSDMKLYIPADYTLHLIDKAGNVSTTNANEKLTPDEINLIRQIRTGDSTSFISPHVSRFAALRDGQIIVLSIPWKTYSAVPRQIAIYTLIIAILTTLLFIGATYFLSQDIAAPLGELRSLAAEMATGNFDVAPRVFADDEVGDVVDSFGETRANLRRLLGRVGGSGATITNGVRVITGGTESLLKHATEQADLTESASLAVENVRGGISSVLAAADTVTELTDDASSRALELQASAEEVARSMDYLFQSVEKTSASTTEMNASMSEMSKRTDVLAGIGDEVLSFVAQMDSTIEELRAGSQATAEISRQVREDAEGGGAAVARTVEGINLSQDLTNSTASVLDDLQKSVGQISQIVNVIEEITGRTNLLALNAAIIAAQAGEHGLGFTVVADEIRELAERTRGSTKEIDAIIRAVQNSSREAVAKAHEGVERVRDNVRLAEGASESLGKIVESSARSYEMATRISRSLEDQATASRHLHEVTSRMSDHIAEINRGTREQARGTQLLAEEAERVREIAGQVRNATDEQSIAGRGISTALEKIAEDARAMRDLLDRQLQETDRIADASRLMLNIAQENDSIAREFGQTVQSLVESGREFESEVGRFRVG